MTAEKTILTALILLAGTATLASAAPGCVRVDAEIAVALDPSCAIADDRFARAHLPDALGQLQGSYGTCFAYSFPATLTFEDASTLEVTMTGVSGRIESTPPIAPFVPFAELELVPGQGLQPTGLIGTWFQAIGSIQAHDASGRLVGVFLTRDQGLLLFDDLTTPVPIPVSGISTLVAKGTLRRRGLRDARMAMLYMRLAPWTGTLASVGDELGLPPDPNDPNPPEPAHLHGLLCPNGAARPPRGR